MISARWKSATIAFGIVGMASLGMALSAARVTARAARDEPGGIAAQATKNAVPPKEDEEQPKEEEFQPARGAQEGMMGEMMAQRRGMGMGGGMMGGGMMATASPGANSLFYLEIAQLDAELADREEDGGPNQAVREALNEKVAMAFSKPTPVHFVLKYVKTALAKSGKPAVSVYVDPLGLQQAGRSLNSTVEVDLEGVPLRTSLRLLLKQLDLAYCARDGVLIISSARGVRDELAEQAARALADDPDGLGQPTEQLLQRLGQGQDRAGMKSMGLVGPGMM